MENENKLFHNNVRIATIAGAIVLGLIAVVLFVGCSRDNALRADTAKLCIENGGTWIYNSCVMPR